MWNNPWSCIPVGGRLGIELWRGALWSVHRNHVALYCLEAGRLEPTCKSRSGRKERDEVGLLKCNKLTLKVNMPPPIVRQVG